MPRLRSYYLLITALTCCFLAMAMMGVAPNGATAQAEEGSVDPLADGLRPFWKVFSGQQQYALQATLELSIGEQAQKVDLDVRRYNADAFDLSVTHPEFAVSIRRRSEATALALPGHKVVYWGQGEVDPADQLAPQGIIDRLVTPKTTVSAYLPQIMLADPQVLSALLSGVLQLQRDPKTGEWRSGEKASLAFPEPGTLSLTIDRTKVRMEISDDVPAPQAVNSWPGMKLVVLERSELERQLSRGVRRALEILAPSPLLTSPFQKTRRVPHGELRWIDGQRVALLAGSPEEVGRAHGELLHDEALACVDSVMYTFGTVQTIRTGRWFRQELAEAYTQLKPHIPERHLRETRALAQSLGLEEELVEAVNVFPEMFHCSGFAVFGKATSDGKLYHGRVLDYMTEIGLQDAATTFIVHVNGQIPFANVGYAGFIGSVSGMNAEAISLGEMGGRGEGQWEGVPMATLMRRALEECDTLDEVMNLWKTSPRTCEYYYVFADGKSNRAVGVAAVPESIEFILPGQFHERLGDGIEDAVVMSAGDRLKTLRERIVSRYGDFDAELGKWLMSRPVAMKSNLHNVLFVPADGVLYVANADHRRPAAECPYVRLDLKALLAEIDKAPAVTPPTTETSSR